LLGQALDLGIDRLGDLLGDEPARVPEEIAEQERRKKRKHRQIDECQLECRRAQQLAKRSHALRSFAREPRRGGGDRTFDRLRCGQLALAPHLALARHLAVASQNNVICRHGSYILRPALFAAMAGQIPCRSSSAIAKYVHR
jgi:hypothetical protein